MDSKITEERYANLPFMSFLPTPPSQKRVSFYSSSNAGQNGNNNNSNSMTSNKSNNINGTISISEKDLKRLSR